MKAMILAAGLGTRLRPLTNDRPKAMVRIKGVPLLEMVIRRLIYFGIKDIIINTHHFSNQITDFLSSKNNFGINISISHEEETPLETGGGLKKAGHFFNNHEPFILCNTDILSNIDLYEMYKTHQSNNAIATLATRQRTTSRYLIFDAGNRLSGWVNVKTGELKMARPITGNLRLSAFSGIQIINPDLFKYFDHRTKFSIIDTYLRAAQTENIQSHASDDCIWLDVGKPPAIETAGEIFDKILENDIKRSFSS